MQNPKLTAMQRQSAVQRFLGESAAAAPPTEDNLGEVLERKSYSILRGRLDLPPSLRLVSLKGRVRSFDYSSITGVNMNSPQELIFPYDGREPYTITIIGQSLDEELLEAMEWKRVLWVQELDELVAASVRKADPKDPVVTGIRIKKGSVSREW